METVIIEKRDMKYKKIVAETGTYAGRLWGQRTLIICRMTDNVISPIRYKMENSILLSHLIR